MSNEIEHLLKVPLKRYCINGNINKSPLIPARIHSEADYSLIYPLPPIACTEDQQWFLCEPFSNVDDCNLRPVYRPYSRGLFFRFDCMSLTRKHARCNSQQGITLISQGNVSN